MSRNKVEFWTHSKENYNRFLVEHKITDKELSYKKYKKIIETCNWMFIEYALRTGFKVTLPFGFGSLAVVKKKIKTYKEYKGKQYVNLRIDWAKTKEVGKRVYHTNEHTDGYNYRWRWSPKDAKFHLSNLYTFKPQRYASRSINKYIKKPNSQFKDLYMEILPQQ